MAILDKLIEKKDIHCYIRSRISFLKNHMGKAVLREPQERREMIRQRFIGRIKELEVLDQLLRQNLVKQMGIANWPETVRLIPPKDGHPELAIMQMLNDRHKAYAVVPSKLIILSEEEDE